MASATQHTFYCIESNCDAEAHVFGGRCDSCFEAHLVKLRKEHNPTRCDHCHEAFDSEHSDLLPSESGRFCGKWCEAGWLKEHDCNGFHYDEEFEAYTCAECRSCYPVLKEHMCSGEIDYENGCYVCDDSDDPRCPQNRAAADPPPKFCPDCGIQREETEPVLLCDWYCPPCWKARFRPEKSCADCGYKPEDGHFPCYRGNDPLCADCEEAAYGPPSPEDWRERSGHCTKCNSNFLIICSSDDRTCCGHCVAKGALPPAAEEMDEECLGCAGPCRPGANGYCSGCWQQRYGCEEE